MTTSQDIAEQQKTESKKIIRKKPNEEEEITEIIWGSISKLLSDIESLDKSINFNEENPKRLATLINSRAKIQQQVYFGIALLRNPKLKLSLGSGKNGDFAMMLKRAILQENSTAKKAEETKQNDSGINSEENSAGEGLKS